MSIENESEFLNVSNGENILVDDIYKKLTPSPVDSSYKVIENAIKHIENNTFPGVLFSYDVQGKPQKVSCTVYANSWTEKLGIPAFQFNYSPN